MVDSSSNLQRLNKKVRKNLLFVQVLQLLLWEMDTVNQVQILDKAVCISYSANTLSKLFSLIAWVNNKADRAI